MIALTHFDNAERKQFFIALAQALLIFKREGLRDVAVRDVQIVDVRHFFLALNVENVEVVNDAGDNFALGAVIGEQQVLLFECFGGFKA